MGYVSTLPIGNMPTKFWPPGSPRGGARGTQTLTPDLLSEIRHGPDLFLGAVRKPILGGLGTHPGPLPDHTRNNLIYPSFWARVTQIHIFILKFDPK